MTEYAQTGVGRFVMGSITEQNKTDHQNKPLDPSRYHFFVAVALPKTDPMSGELLGKLFNKANADYAANPGILSVIGQGLAGPFKFKIDDGDDPKYADKVDANNVPTCSGCWILKMSTTFDSVGAAVFENGVTRQCDPSEINRGDYVDVSISYKANGLTDQNAGMFINPQTVRLVGRGAAIVSGPSLEDQFSNAPTVPAGVTTAPVSPPAGSMPAGNGMPATTQTQSSAPAAQGMPTGDAAMTQTSTASPSEPVQPHTAILGGTGMPGA